MSTENTNLIDAYLYGGLSKEEQHDFEKRVNSDQNLAEEFALEKALQLIGAELAKQDLEQSIAVELAEILSIEQSGSIKENVDRGQVKPPTGGKIVGIRRWILPMSAAAAVIILVLWFIVPINQSPITDFIPPLTSSNPNYKSGDNSIPRDTRMSAFNTAFKSKDWQRCREIVKYFPAPLDFTDSIDRGTILAWLNLAEGNTQQAEKRFQELLQRIESRPEQIYTLVDLQYGYYLCKLLRGEKDSELHAQLMNSERRPYLLKLDETKKLPRYK
jgi:hypothetical protein